MAASTAELTLRMVVSLVLIGTVLLLAVKLTKGRLRTGARRSGIGVHARHQLTKASSVTVIQAGERYFLLGVNDASVTLLAEGDDLVLTEPGSDVVDVRSSGSKSAKTERGARKRHGRADTGTAPAGKNVIEVLREKTVRRG